MEDLPIVLIALSALVATVLAVLGIRRTRKLQRYVDAHLEAQQLVTHGQRPPRRRTEVHLRVIHGGRNRALVIYWIACGVVTAGVLLAPVSALSADTQATVSAPHRPHRQRSLSVADAA